MGFPSPCIYKPGITRKHCDATQRRMLLYQMKNPLKKVTLSIPNKESKFCFTFLRKH
ncbi:hypothetical protein LguiB_011928 [Lonicera macranthoides]